MKKIGFIIFCFLIFVTDISAINDSATSSILVDINSNRILYKKNIKEVRSVASISKIMTAIVAIESGKLDEEVIIDEEVLKAYGSSIYIKVGDKIKLEDLVYGLMLRSGNDAALAIAKHVSGSKENFVKLMNDKAEKIGMLDTAFNNPSGLDEVDEVGNFSTAYDMALLTSYAYKNEIYKKIAGTKNYTVKTSETKYSWENKNKFLFNYELATGGKTGYTEIAKRTLVTTSSNNNNDFVVVTLNDGNDFEDHENIHDYGYENYNTYTLLKAGKINIDDNFYNNQLYIETDLKVALLKEEKDRVKLNYNIEKNKSYKNNDVVGSVDVVIDNDILATKEIIYKEPKKGNSDIISNIIDWFKKLW